MRVRVGGIYYNLFNKTRMSESLIFLQFRPDFDGVFVRGWDLAQGDRKNTDVEKYQRGCHGNLKTHFTRKTWGNFENSFHQANMGEFPQPSAFSAVYGPMGTKLYSIIWGRRDAATYVCSIFTPWKRGLQWQGFCTKSYNLLWSYYNLSSVCACQSHGGNPIGKALVIKNCILTLTSGERYHGYR